MRVLDLFAGGCGGWSLGMHRAGYRTVAACEIDPWRRAVFARNFPGVRMYDDVRCLDAARLSRDLGRLPSIIVGSPPCQDASTANAKGKGVDGERTGLFFAAIRLVAECRPVWGCLENVPGIRARGVDRVLAELEALGYACWPLVVGAVHAGAPHRRNRAWVVFADAATVQRASFAWREPDGADAGAAADSSRHGLRQQQGRCGGPGRAGEAEPRDDGAIGSVAYADEAGLEGTRPRAGGAGPQIALYSGGLGDGWDQTWNGGLAARLGRMDDGLPKGMARAALAAYGDSVVPQITEAIGRAMSRLLPTEAAA